ncbi:MAG TPA: hypothetical protein VHF87_05030 [Methylomirabilota bacterium]|jgi:hypothetical protein|nr:hypothetical protein [Methylomirabilota bacterium]
MGRRFTAVAVTVLLGASAAWAQSPPPRTDSAYTDTVYATDQHMGFSIRNAVLRWFGGVDVARERDAKAAEKDGWWGDPVAQVSPELARAPKSDR